MDIAPRCAAGTAELVRATALVKTYAGALTALDRLTFSLRRGTVGLVGANGAGKSTLFRILLGLTKPDSGTVIVDGIDVADDPIAVRQQVGYMPEHDCLPLDQSAADIVATLGEISGLPPRVARQRASDVLDLVGLDEARFRPVGGFSTGMRQRAKLAQALVADPTLVLLDEPTAGLDPAGRHDMLELIRRLGTLNISVILATHLLDDVQATCDQVVMIDAGRLVASGRTDELLETTGLVRVDVDGRGDELVDALTRTATGTTPPLAGTVLADGTVEIPTTSDDDLDRIVAAVHAADLPLHSLSTRRSSLDQVFIDHSRPHSATGTEPAT